MASSPAANSAPLPALLQLPPEILHKILSYSGAVGVAHFSQTCRSAQLFCHSPALFKALFLNSFDPPPAQLTFSFPYRPALVARTRTELRLAYIRRTRELRSAEYSQDERHLFVSSLVAAADGRASVNQGDSLNQAWLERVYDENILKRLVPRPTPNEVRTTSPSPTAQLSSRLHCLANPALRVTHRVRTAAREILYEAASFGRSSNWGPFMKMTKGHKGGLEVDWRKMEALAIVMAANIDEEIEAGWGEGEERRPVGWESTRKEEVGEGVRDWAGVESGTWRGTYAFLDFRSFDHYNVHRFPGIPSLANEMEAVGDVMELNLKIVEDKDLPDHADEAFDLFDPATLEADDPVDNDPDFVADGVDAPGPTDASTTTSDDTDDGPARADAIARATPAPPRHAAASASATPPLQFRGTTMPIAFRGTLPNGLAHTPPDRNIRGTVSMTADGHVHWQYVISYAGASRWMMQGVQVGGPRSKFGVIGTWSTADHEEGGPHGPFWYWPEQAREG